MQNPHVDVVKNEWLAGFQHVVARVWEDLGRLVVESPERETWEPIILGRGVREPTTGEVVEAEKEPERFLHLLPANIHGTYLFATEPHPDHECPFADRPLIPIRPMQGPTHFSTA